MIGVRSSRTARARCSRAGATPARSTRTSSTRISASPPHETEAARKSRTRVGSVRPDRRGDRGERHLDGERRATVGAGAVGAHRAGVVLDDVPNDREPEAETLPRRARRLAEALEDMREELLRDAAPRVAHGEARAVPGALDPDGHGAAVGGELDRV